MEILRALSVMTSGSFTNGEVLEPMRNLRLHMSLLAEQVAEESPALGPWFDAERQGGLYRARMALEHTRLIQDLDQTTEDDLIAASEPFHRWVAEFTSNLRSWKAGNVMPDQLLEQTARIKEKLEELGEWRESLSWRKDLRVDGQ